MYQMKSLYTCDRAKCQSLLTTQALKNIQLMILPGVAIVCGPHGFAHL